MPFNLLEDSKWNFGSTSVCGRQEGAIEAAMRWVKEVWIELQANPTSKKGNVETRRCKMMSFMQAQALSAQLPEGMTKK